MPACIIISEKGGKTEEVPHSNQQMGQNLISCCTMSEVMENTFRC